MPALDANVFGVNFHLAQCHVWAEAGGRSIARVLELPTQPPRLRIERLGCAYLGLLALHQALEAGHWVRLSSPEGTRALAPAELDDVDYRKRVQHLRDVVVHQSESIEDGDLVVDPDGPGYQAIRVTARPGSPKPVGTCLTYTEVADVLVRLESWVALHMVGRPAADRDHVSPDPKRKPKRRPIG